MTAPTCHARQRERPSGRTYARAAYAGALASMLTALCGAGCGANDQSSGRAIFDDEVVPILEARCAAPVCHGVLPDAIERGEVIDEAAYMLDVGSGGRITDRDAAYEATLDRINTVESPHFSSLLRHPLPTAWGGTPHGGGDNFTSTADPAYETIVEWIEAEGSGGEDPVPLTPLQQYFADEVQPLLLGRSCGLTNCHGPSSFVSFRLESGLPSPSGELLLSNEMTRHNYEESRRMLALAGDAGQSRLLRKALPLSDGGIRHRGGNSSFLLDPDDAAREILREWHGRELAEAGRTPEVEGVVFVRGPLATGSVFDDPVFAPGSELMLLQPPDPSGALSSLTGELLTGVEIRDPAISPDGQSVVFSLRRSEADAYRLVVLDLNNRTLRDLTTGTDRLTSGAPVTDLMPTVGPDGWVYFSSNRHDVVAERGDAHDLDLYRIPLDGGEVERLTWTPSPEREPAIFGVGAFRDYVVFEVRRAVGAIDETVGFSFPIDRHVDYHIFFGITPSFSLLTHFRELPDGRAVVLVGERTNAWEGGALGVVDRSLGPDLLDSMDPSVASIPGYLPTLALVDPDASTSGASLGGAYRDPIALPDGSILAAWTPGPVDLSDPESARDFGIVRIELDEAPDGCVDAACGPRITDRSMWVDEPGVDDHSPVPIIVRDEYPIEPALHADDDALFSMIDIVVNDNVMAQLPPTGERSFRDDVRAVRLVEALQSAGGTWGSVDADDPGCPSPPCSTSTIGRHMPSRVLGEIPVESDGSLFAAVPPNTPFRTQLLDADGMSVGVQHNRWLFVWDGQHFSQSTHQDLYDERCGGCHGSSSSDPLTVLGPPDVTTRATLTLSRFEDRNPRLPRDPVMLGDETAFDIDFRTVIGPLFERTCAEVGCHAAEDPAGGLRLVGEPTALYDTAYEALLGAGDRSDGGREYVDEAHARARSSFLMEVLLNRELDAPGMLVPHPSIALDPAELADVIRWIETGAHYDLP